MGEETISSNKRIAKNTIMLYIRMLLSMVVSLYTSRVVLNTLGVEDFGIYNVVGGIVVLFTFVNNAMASATQRFLNFELGRQNLLEVKRVFSMSMTAHVFIALLVLLLAETIGLWFFSTQLNIPEKRIFAANWVYQMSIMTCCVSILRVPYNASVIAYEKMSFFAYVSIIEVLLKLLIVYLLVLGDIDKLILYSILTFIVTLITSIIYQIYCKWTFKSCSYVFFWDTKLLKRLVSFSVWSLFGSAANIASYQGGSILLNIFCGVVANTAMGIANQVNSAVYSFVSNFQTAFIPQLIKQYAAGNQIQFNSLVGLSSRLSFYLIFILGFPIFVYSEFLLRLWLVEVPMYAVEFTKLILLSSIFDALSGPLWSSVQATGKIKKYQLAISSILSLNILFSYLLLVNGGNPCSVLIVKLLLNVAIYVYRIFYLNRIGLLNIREYANTLFVKSFIIILLMVPISSFISKIVVDWKIKFVLLVGMSFLIVCLVGFTKSEHRFIMAKLKLYN